jgi:two-component system cell cycle sensor histidine kinase/response regulator CckA
MNRRTILIVDDEPMIRTVVGRLLEEWDFKVVEADNGQTALDLARKIRGSLSMVITDVIMPIMGGYDFAHTFRPLYPNVPILFITGNSPGSVPGSVSLARGEPLLFKPFDPDLFLDTVARLLESRINGRRHSA